MRQATRHLRAALLAGLIGAGCGEAAPRETRTTAAPPSPAPPTPRPVSSAPSQSPEDASRQYATLLAGVVTDAGLVRYDRLAEPERRRALEAVVRWIAAASLPKDEAARMAFWCNAYNANVLAMAVDASLRQEFQSVEKVPGFFDERPIAVAGETLTLNELENERIRPLADPRIHAALVCAAMSCPPLRNEPYTAEKLEAQLNDQCVRWVNDPTKFRVVDGRLGLSEILKWYAADFGRPPYGSQTGFVLAYARSGSPLARYIINTADPRTRWLTYDWSLNRAPGAAPRGG